jgi:AAA domain/UvrD-like helicase C-terminal domain
MTQTKYQPSSLKTLGDANLQYFIGCENPANNQGPFYSEIQCLEYVGSEKDFIFSLNSENKIEKLWFWEDGFWNKIQQRELSNDQQLAVKRLHVWVKNPKESFFVLKGYAGTGKTFLLKTFVEDIKEKYVFYFTAPTNKASKVLSKALGLPAQTTYSCLGLKMSHNEDNLELVFSKKTYFPKNSIVVLDEGGQAGSVLFNKLLEAVEEFKIKLLVVGDPAQLNPVKERKSKVWKLAEGENSAFLKQVMRFDDVLLKLATAIRTCIKQKNWVSPFVDCVDNKKVFLHSRHKFIEHACIAIKKNPQESKILAWRNSQVDNYNKIIRDYLGFREDFCIGDVLFVASPVEINGSIVASTDEEVKVLDVQSSSIKVQVGLILKEIETWKLLVESDKKLNFEVAKDYSDVLDILNLLAKVPKRTKMKKDWKPYWDFKNKFHQVRYGYAITAHRSQGSTYENVYIDQQDILKNSNNLESFRCLYVACTRASLTNHTF